MAMCGKCELKKAQADGFCPSCRMQGLGLATRKYRFTEELHRELRAAYRLKKYERARALDRLVKQTSWPRHAFVDEAIRLALPGRGRARKWTAAEDQWLQERVGTVSVKYMATTLKRSARSVESRIARLGELRRERREGYSVMVLHTAFGVMNSTIKSWMRRGLLGPVEESGGLRVKEENVVRFIRNYPQEYDLRRVDQTWYKAMLFGQSSEVA